MINKLLLGIVTIIVLAIAVEGGYYWGISSSASQSRPKVNNPLSESSNNINIATTPTPGSSLPPESQLKSDISKMFASFPPQVYWSSSWYSSFGATLVDFDDKTLVFDIDGAGIKKIDLTKSSPNISFTKYYTNDNRSEIITRDEIKIGEQIGISLGVDTSSGEIKELTLIKIVTK